MSRRLTHKHTHSNSSTHTYTHTHTHTHTHTLSVDVLSSHWTDKLWAVLNPCLISTFSPGSFNSWLIWLLYKYINRPVLRILRENKYFRRDFTLQQTFLAEHHRAETFSTSFILSIARDENLLKNQFIACQKSPQISVALSRDVFTISGGRWSKFEMYVKFMLIFFRGQNNTHEGKSTM